jgi:hypothetical protein
MRLNVTRILIFSMVGITLALISVFAYVAYQFEDYCEEGSGLTTIKIEVRDINTRQLIDSVELTVLYGASADEAVDTLVAQGNGVSYNFTIPEDCEPYWLEVTNKYYWYEPLFIDTVNEKIDTVYQGALKKGELNEFVAYLKPASVIKLTLERELNNSHPDTVFLDLMKGDQILERWGYYSKIDFEEDTVYFMRSHYIMEDNNGRRKITVYFPIEADNTDLKIQWTRKDQEYIDTLFIEFKAVPFDTVQLSYEFRK